MDKKEITALANKTMIFLTAAMNIHLSLADGISKGDAKARKAMISWHKRLLKNSTDASEKTLIKQYIAALEGGSAPTASNIIQFPKKPINKK